MKHEELLRQIAFILLLVGGIDLGLYGLMGSDIIMAVLGHFLGRLLFILIGVAAGFKIYLKYVVKK